MQNFSPSSPQSYSQSGVQSTFFGKVMAFFAFAILSSAAGAYITLAYFMNVFYAFPFIMFLLFAAELALIFTAKKWSKITPLNRVLFALFAFISGVTTAPLLSIVLVLPMGTAILVKALLATGFMFAATAMIGWTTKRDLSGLRGFLIMSLIGMIIVGVLGIFIPWGTQFEMIFSGIGIILFSAFTMYDFQKLKSYPEDMYIEAALSLYLDIFNMFLFVLRFLTSITRN